MPAISIIIPFFNAADTLHGCVDSVIAQTISDWELLLVDDGSTDDSAAICQQYQDQDPRIRLYQQRHKGVSAARNLALDQMTGDYVCFVDADDIIEPDYLEKLYEYRDYDMVICGYYVDRKNSDGSLIKQSRNVPAVVDIQTLLDKRVLASLFLMGMININCNKLLHTEIIKKNTIRYPNYPINEDYLFMLDYLSHCNSIKTIENSLYHWVRISGRKTGVSQFSNEAIKAYYLAHLNTIRFFNQREIAGEIMYYSYYYLVLKCFEQEASPKTWLDELLKNSLVKDSFRFHSPNSFWEKFLLFLLQKHYYRLFWWLHCWLTRETEK